MLVQFSLRPNIEGYLSVTETGNFMSWRVKSASIADRRCTLDECAKLRRERKEDLEWIVKHSLDWRDD